MPKNRHSSRDAKIQPSEANEIDRPLMSYTAQPPHTKPNANHPTSATSSNPEPIKARPAALKLESTTAPSRSQLQQQQQQLQQQQQQQQQQNKAFNAGSQSQFQKAPVKKSRTQYCPKHTPNPSNNTPAMTTRASAAGGKTKPHQHHQPTETLCHSCSLKKAARENQNHSNKACQLESTPLPVPGQPPRNAPANRQPVKSSKNNATTKSPPSNDAKPKAKGKKVKDDNTATGKEPEDKNGKKRRVPEVTAIPQTNMSIGLLVFCCFNPLLGALAIYLSLTAAKAYRDGNHTRGATRAHWSILMSLFGIMITMVIVSSLVVFIAVSKHSNKKQNSIASLPQGL